MGKGDGILRPCLWIDQAEGEQADRVNYNNVEYCGEGVQDWLGPKGSQDVRTQKAVEKAADIPVRDRNAVSVWRG